MIGVKGWNGDMAERITKIIEGTVQVAPFMQVLYDKIIKALETGAVAVDLYRPEERRSNDSNAKLWAMVSDISKQLEWYGQNLTPEHWKELLSHDWKSQAIVPAISGGFCAIGVRTSKLNKREFSELIEIIYAFGANHGIVWSEPSLQAFSEYREAKQ